jgi:hypothetical protein
MQQFYMICMKAYISPLNNATLDIITPLLNWTSVPYDVNLFDLDAILYSAKFSFDSILEYYIFCKEKTEIGIEI